MKGMTIKIYYLAFMSVFCPLIFSKISLFCFLLSYLIMDKFPVNIRGFDKNVLPLPTQFLSHSKV